LELIKDKEYKNYQLLYSGYTLIHNIDEDEAVNYASRLGEFILQKGEIKHIVKWTSGFDEFAYSKSLNYIGPHTEYPYLEKPPKYQALYCRRRADIGGETYLSDTNSFFQGLSTSDIQLLKTTIVNFMSNEALNGIDKGENFQPIFEELGEESIIRFSHNLFSYGDINGKIEIKEGKRISFFENKRTNMLMNNLLDYSNSNHMSIQIPENSMLIWNNHRILHWRNKYKDRKRELVRFLIK